MGYNADNLFVQTTDRDALLRSVSVVFAERKWKVALSAPLDGWIQIIESHDNTPPDVARAISENIKCVTVCAQLYETAGENAWFVFENGIEVESAQKETADDPAGEVKDFLMKTGVPFEMRLFREVIKQNQGWVIEKNHS
ncbi:MAG: hypothetical protein HZB47_03455 [Nitrosomonadales bacterium]|nr:hypothetical protein [Nitrosomonadales bacterium]